METLTLEQLAPYLPYSVMAQDINTKEVRLVTLLHFTYNTKTVGHNHLIYNGLLLSKHLLVLRPLSDLTKKIEHNGEMFVPIDVLKNEFMLEQVFDKNIFDFYGFKSELGSWTFIHDGKEIHDECPIFIYNILIKWHFDVFGLIQKNLAIDINQIK